MFGSIPGLNSLGINLIKNSVLTPAILNIFESLLNLLYELNFAIDDKFPFTDTFVNRVRKNERGLWYYTLADHFQDEMAKSVVRSHDHPVGLEC